MKFSKDGMDFIVSPSVDNDIIIFIVDPSTQKLIDVATIHLSVYNQIDNSVDIDIVSLFNKAHDIFERTRIPVIVLDEINKMKQGKEVSNDTLQSNS